MTQDTTDSPTPYRSTPEAIMRELYETHAVEAYLADNLASAKVERDEALAEVERLTGSEARERLARHLWIQACSDDPTAQKIAAADWDRGDCIDRTRWYTEADEIMALLAGKEG